MPAPGTTTSCSARPSPGRRSSWPGARAITESLTIDGCSNAPNSPDPCVGLRGADKTVDALDVRADGVTVRGLAITNAAIGIAYEKGHTGLLVRGSWLGVGLGGGAEANAVGIELAGDGAEVGGTGGATGNAPADRNVVVANGVGIRVLGGDQNRILGNYVGVKADGSTAAGNELGVLVAGIANDPASGNVVGGRVSEAAAATPSCDDACNVISGTSAGLGLNLHGANSSQTPAVDAIVRGNFVGLDAAGSSARPNRVGIAVGRGVATIGGDAGARDRNYVAGGLMGISYEQIVSAARPSSLQGNFVGLDSSGSVAVAPPANAGIAVLCFTADSWTVAENRVVTSGGRGLVIQGEHGVVSENTVGLGTGGEIFPPVPFSMVIEGANLSIADNTLASSSGSGIWLHSGQNVPLAGNRIGVGEGHGVGTGIRLEGTVSGNTIGGDGAAANRIENAGRGITIGGDGNDRNRIGDNRGHAQVAFIDVTDPVGPGNDPATGANAGIQAPAITAAGNWVARGTAVPGATVQVFLSGSGAGAFPAGIDDLLGSATAGPSGAWELEYDSALAPGSVVTAIQTDAQGNSSEPSPGAGLDETPPGAVLITGGPADLGNDPTPTFDFEGEPEALLFCFLDQDEPVRCDGAFTAGSPLSEGEHAFHVVQMDAAGNFGPETTREFELDLTAPAAPAIVAGPVGQTTVAVPAFAFTGEPDASFSCDIDNGPPAPCDGGSFSPAAPLGIGEHVFRVVQTDAAGNSSPETARGFALVRPSLPPRVDSRAPDTKVKGPRRVTAPRARFLLGSSEAGSTFQCRLDRGPFKSCRTKLTLKRLTGGRHLLRVRAIDRAGNVDPTPARKAFRVGVT